MIVFDDFNKTGNSKCPVCQTNKSGKTVLVRVDGTSNGELEEGMQIHVGCLDLRISSAKNNHMIVYQKI